MSLILEPVRQFATSPSPGPYCVAAPCSSHARKRCCNCRWRTWFWRGYAASIHAFVWSEGVLIVEKAIVFVSFTGV